MNVRQFAVVLYAVAVVHGFVGSRGARAADAGSEPDALARAGETLHNGIVLPAEWPPGGRSTLPREPETPPYLMSPPKVIPIDGGRQLFVDDFLIETTTLERTYHQAGYRRIPPTKDASRGPVVLRPDRPWEMTPPSPCAMPFSDGVFWDPADGLYKMWYMAGYVAGTGYATSRDGIEWEKPELDVFPGTNLVQRGRRDSSTAWLDHGDRDPARRFKMGFYRDGALLLSTSPDGIHWSDPIRSGPTGDRSTFFRDPFRERWVFSLRAGIPGDPRVRRFWEARDLLGGAQWKPEEPVLWTGADDLDPPREDLKTTPQLYNLDCVAYESLLVGLFSIWRGQPKDRPKPNEICLGFSRDGFHWSRPDRRPFLPVSEQAGAWNWGNVQSAGGGFLVVWRELRFYVSGRAGVTTGTADSGECVTALATLRRDGFASLGGDGEVVTRPVTFRGKHLFVNVAVPTGSLRAEVLDEAGVPIEPFTLERCEAIERADETCRRVSWRGAPDLSALAGRAVRFRFRVVRGSLYSFWVSPRDDGASLGPVAAGGPGFRGPIDDVGMGDQFPVGER